MVIALTITTNVIAQDDEAKPVKWKLRHYSKIDFSGEDRFPDEKEMRPATAFAILYKGTFKITGNGLGLNLMITGDDWDTKEVDHSDGNTDITKSIKYAIDVVDTSDGEAGMLHIVEIHSTNEYEPITYLIQVNFRQVSRMGFAFMGVNYEN